MKCLKNIKQIEKNMFYSALNTIWISLVHFLLHLLGSLVSMGNQEPMKNTFIHTSVLMMNYDKVLLLKD